MSKKLLTLIPITSVGLVACGNNSIDQASEDLSNTLNNIPSAAPSINVSTGNAEVDGLVAQLNDLLQQAWNWGITSLQGLIDQIPVINQLV